MQWLKNISVAKKITTLIFISVLFLLGVGGTGYYYLQSSKTELQQMYAERLLPIQMLNENRTHARAVEADFLHLMITVDDKEKKRLLTDIEKRVAGFNENMEQYRKSSLDSAEQKVLQEMLPLLQKYRDERQAVLKLAAENKNTEAYQLYYQNVSPIMESFQKKLVELSIYNQRQAVEAAKQNEKEFTSAVTIIAGVILTALLLTGLIGWTISRMITLPLKSVVGAAEQVASGNLGIRELDVSTQDEIGHVAASMNSMIQNLRALITQINNSAEQVAASSEQLTASAEQTALAAGQVASSVTEVAEGAERQLSALDKSSNAVTSMHDNIRGALATATTVSASSE